MAAKIKWSDKAVANLNHLYSFIAFDSEVYAKRFIKTLVKITEVQLQRFPLIGRPVPEFQNTPLSFLREVIYKGYRIIYNVALAEEITIVAVVSGRMDLPGMSKSDWEIE